MFNKNCRQIKPVLLGQRWLLGNSVNSNLSDSALGKLCKGDWWKTEGCRISGEVMGKSVYGMNWKPYSLYDILLSTYPMNDIYVSD